MRIAGIRAAANSGSQDPAQRLCLPDIGGPVPLGLILLLTSPWMPAGL